MVDFQCPFHWHGQNIGHEDAWSSILRHMNPSMWGPTVMWTLVDRSPRNTIVISTINHSYWSYLHQLRYLTGASHWYMQNIWNASTGGMTMLFPRKTTYICWPWHTCSQRKNGKAWWLYPAKVSPANLWDGYVWKCWVNIPNEISI